MLYGEILVINCADYMQYMNTLCGQTAEFLVLSLAIYIVTKM
jgi:hypothetical protein